MPFIRYTAKKILMITALSNTLAPMVKTYIRAGVIIESVIDCVRWASLACPGAFYIYENFLKKFLPEPNIGHYPFGTMDEREIEISSMCWWKGKEVNPSYAEGCHCFAREAYKGYPILRDNRYKIYLISCCLKSTYEGN